MQRTIELGRAVLSLPSKKLELWLTTLITISPAQDATDLKHLSDNETIDLLASGSVWVERGNGMRLSLDITLHREPLPGDQLRQISDSIVNAPVSETIWLQSSSLTPRQAWKQFGLQPSLPADENFRQGQLHLNIGQHREETIVPTKRPHGAYTNAPSQGVTPPEGVPTILLHSVESAVVITESRSRTSATKLKQTKKTFGGAPESLEDDMPYEKEGEEEELEILFDQHSATFHAEDSVIPFRKDPSILFGEKLEMPLNEIVPQPHAEVEIVSAKTHMTSIRPQKRSRSSTTPNKRQEDDTLPGLIPAAKRQRPSTMTTMLLPPATTSMTAQLNPIEVMIDASMRISVCNSLRGSLGSFKIKANTFSESLADIAPALWRPGYRSVRET
jgi:hypothetical protein